MPLSRSVALSVVLLLLAVPSFAKDWWVAYEEGVKAARAGNWDAVVRNMNDAISGNGSENNKARPYGTIFVNYHPYYYRGVANFKLGNYREAIADLKKSSGPGAYDAGSISDLIERANDKLSGPPPTTTRENPPPPPPPTNTSRDVQIPNTTTTRPTLPTTSPAEAAAQQARSRAEGMLKQAEGRAKSAIKAGAPRYDSANFNKGESIYNNAVAARASARSAEDWNHVADLADQATRTYDVAMTAARIAAVNGQGKIDQAVDQALAGIRVPLKEALRDYFGGRFSRSASSFKKLTAGVGADYPLLWAFQGAALYYDYYLDGSSNGAKRAEATAAFRRAKALNPKMRSLPAKYFSPRVRRFYESVN
jgi:tetratricopeptide (TPR) repeat protein